jgi:hypothetical protein
MHEVLLGQRRPTAVVVEAPSLSRALDVFERDNLALHGDPEWPL